MTQYKFPAHLDSANFPANVEELASSVVLVDSLENRASGANPEYNQAVGQAYYLQNVMPIVRGFSSVHFLRQLGAAPFPGVRVDKVYQISDPDNSIALFSPAGGRNLVFDPDTGAWAEHSLTSVIAQDAQVVTLKSQHYIYYPGVGLYQYNFQDKEIRALEIQAIEVTNLLGLAAAGGQLIFWDETQLYLSSVTDPLDFTPSVSTGAGSAGIVALRGKIIKVVPIDNGFNIYTTEHVINATPSGNISVPWIYKEVQNSSGIGSPDHVAGGEASSFHVAWTGSGFMQVSANEASPIWPELTQGIMRQLAVRLSVGLPTILTTSPIDLRLRSVGTQYLVVSMRTEEEKVNNQSYQEAWVFDLTLRRWGRLVVPHEDIFEFSVPQYSESYTYAMLAEDYATYGDLIGIPYSAFEHNLQPKAPIPGKNFGLIKHNAEVFTVGYASRSFPQPSSSDPLGIVAAGAAEPRLFLGRYKVRRTRGITLETIMLSTLFSSQIIAHSHDYNGNFVFSKSINSAKSVTPGTLYGRHTGDSVSLELRGKFAITDLTIICSENGARNMPHRPLISGVTFNGIPVVHEGQQVTVDLSWLS